MVSKRSYLDNINTGRQRRPGTSIDQISQTLDQIEDSLERAFDTSERRSGSDRDITRRMQRLSAEAAGGRQHERADVSRASLESLARDLERTRRQEDEFASVGGIAAELKTLREEVRQLMNAGLRREFDSLREEIAHVMHSAPAPGADNARLGAEFERLSEAIGQLAERSDDRSIRMLRQELEQVKESLDTLAREDTLRSVDRRWDEFDDRLNAFEDRVSSSLREGSDPAVAALHRRLEQIGEAVDSLPQSLSLHSLEERVRTLAGALAQFIEQHDRNRPDLYGMIDERLDEISRAIAASSASAQSVSFDPTPFERIEARIASLARQIGELIEDHPRDEVMERINALAERVDAIAERMDAPEHAVERLAGQIGAISRKLDTVPRSREADRFLEGLEARLEDISGRLQDSTAHISSIDPDVIGNLQAQVASLSEHLTQRRPDLPEFEDVGPRLDKIEQSIAQNREAILEAARQAAEQAIGALAASRNDPQAEDGLRGELQSLEALARKSDERNTKTFEAIHDTLLKIVERLGRLESGEGVHSSRKEAVPADRAGPAASGSEEDTYAASNGAAPPRTPAEAAVEAAKAALEEGGAGDADQEERRSMLGSLAQALAARQHGDDDSRNDPEGAPRVEAGGGQASEVEHANEPLEPGSGAPDLNAIMRRVRDEHDRPRRETEAETAKSDFIAAARRAAQAAAAEAEMKKALMPSDEDGGRLGIGRLFRSKKKTALMMIGVSIIALGAMQLGKAVFSEGPARDRVAGLADEAPAGKVVPHPESPAGSTAAAEVSPVRVVDDRAEARDTVATESRAQPEAQRVRPSVAQSGDEAPDLSSAPVADPSASMAANAQAVPSEAAPAMDDVKLDIPAVGPVALREAAASGDAKAFFEIGSRYAEGRGVETDMAEAAEWYRRAAELGLAPAQYRLGNFLDKGIGVERDLEEARVWYQLAAEQGNASAMHNLGVLYAMGAEGVSDNESAARWFLEAAERGVKDSQFNLGILSAKGVGVPKDLEESYKWFDLVARKGDEDAAAKRDEIAAVLTPEQLERAKGKAELWREKAIEREANIVAIPEEWGRNELTTASVDMKQVVTNIQHILNKNGFDAGPADGVMGERTRTAIMAFQKENGLQPTGRIDEALVNSLLEHN